MKVQRLEPLAVTDNCTGEYGCPGIYKTDQGSLAVQGPLRMPPAGAMIPAGEAFVDIPRELLIEAARRLLAEGEGGEAS